MHKLGIIDIGSGNLFSLIRSLKPFDIEVIIVNREEKIQELDGILLPGVGAFKSGIETLKNNNMINALNEHKKKGKPILGICLGMQLLLSESSEFGVHKGLDFIKGKVKLIKKKDKWPVPNIGWCDINNIKNNKLSPFNNIKNHDDFYFIHSYFCDLQKQDDIIGEIIYGGENIPAMISHENIHGCQFHPELSARSGYIIFENFIKLLK